MGKKEFNKATRDANIREAGRRGMPAVSTEPGKQAAKSTKEIRDKLPQIKTKYPGARLFSMPKIIGSGRDIPIIKKPRVPVRIEALTEDHPIIQDLIVSYTEEWKKTHTKDKKNRSYFYFGDAGRCPRELYYHFHHAKEKRDLAISTIMMFKMGDLFHDEIQNRYRKMGATANRFIEFGAWEKTNFEKSGRLDLFIVETSTGSIPILEIKSKNPYAFEAKSPGEEEVDQLVSYIDAAQKDPWLKEHYPPVPDYGYVLYVERSGLADPLPLKAWQVWRNDGRWPGSGNFLMMFGHR